MADKTFHFFSGTDCTITFSFTRADSTKQIITVGNIAAIQGVVKVEGTPRYCLGEADPVGFSSGKRLISGTMVLESLNRAFITELNELLDDEFKYNYNVEDASVSNGTETFEVSKLFYKYADQLPEFDITIDLVRPDDSSIRAQRTLVGCKIVSESSGIGLSTLDIQEQLYFLAREISPLRKI